MGRAASRSSAELYDLSKVWLVASEDPIVGIDQTAFRFVKPLHRQYFPRATRDTALKARDEELSAKSAKSEFDKVAADVQKFKRALRIVIACNPTDLVEDQTL